LNLSSKLYPRLVPASFAFVFNIGKLDITFDMKDIHPLILFWGHIHAIFRFATKDLIEMYDHKFVASKGRQVEMKLSNGLAYTLKC